MAQRKEARIFVTIWDDDAFRALTPGPQRMYLYLLSQIDLSYCGVISLRERRWARDAKGLTVDDVVADLEALAKPFPEGLPEGFPEGAHRPLIVIDEDAGELLVRSLIRNDGIWKQPNFLKAARESATLIRSASIKAALREELLRIPVDESPSVQVKAIIAEFVADLEKGLPKGSRKGSANPSAEGGADPSGKGLADPSSEGSQGNRGDQLPVVETSPVPREPVPPPAGPDEPGGATATAVATASEPKTVVKPRKSRKAKASRTPQDDQADELTNGYWERYGTTTTHKWIAVRQVVLTPLMNGVSRDELAFALDQIGRERQPVTQNTLMIALKQLKEQREHASGAARAAAPVDRRQQATNDLFDRALERARALDAMEANGEP